ncbi:winged helix-turn-helix domain-containing protein [Deinococcus sp. Marseille-Q6407]|uniref:winged helix-turn-helix domain-containing protein n=1 Tax=Deinococcus sp. Marseille-Q6407 TaxID=2969223 RepID=UPI0021C253B6|nr:winged helix-turn-helix domain-containing protein [Deinococcus sp. Marseille-Q6407]
MPKPRVVLPHQAKLLLDPDLLFALHALMREPLSVGDLAAQLGISGRRAYSTVDKLRRAGIAAQVGERRRRGRPIRLYQVPQPWLVPYTQTGAASVSEFFWQQYGDRLRHLVDLIAQAAMQDRDDWGYWLAAGRLELGTLDGPLPVSFAAPQLFTLRELRLGERDTDEFRAQLLALCRDYEARSHPDAPALALGLLLARGNWWETAPAPFK